MPQDIRYAWRVLRKSPGFTLVVVLTLALGIGANTAVFSVVDGVLLHSLPYKDPARLVDILDSNVKDANLSKTFGAYSDFEEYSRSSHSFEKIAFATWAVGGATLRGHGPARNVLAIPASEDLFAVLGVSAARGRTFEHADMAHGCSVVLADSFWRITLASDSNIVGKTLDLDHRACSVLGVMPATFEFYPRATQMWMLLTPDDPRPRDKLLVLCFARLKSGVSAAVAQAELAPIHRSIHPSDWQRDFTPSVNGLQDEFTFLAGRNLRATLRLLLGAVVFVLLIACVNVANLLLGRLSARAREFAVRAALGSGSGRLIRQLLIEASLPAIMGGVTGLFIALACIRYFLHANPIELPIGSSVTMNIPVLAFSALVTMTAALIFGLAPAWRGSQAGVEHGLRNAGRGSIYAGNRRLTSALIALEISLSLVLVAGGSMLMRSVLKMGSAPLGFDPANVLAVNANLPAHRYSSAAEKIQYYDQLHARLTAIPGIESAAIAATFPPTGGGNYEMQIQGKGRTRVQDVQQNLVSDDYFRVLRIPLQQGRLFTRKDGEALVGVVNEVLVRKYFSAENPIGRQIRLFGFSDGPWVTIVGVVANEKHPELMHEMTWSEQPALYRPIAEDPPSSFSIGLRTAATGLAIGPAIEKAVTGLDPETAVGGVAGLNTRLSLYLKYPRFRAIVIDGFAGLALLLCALGLHGLLAQYVGQRRRELGLRMAIGAKKTDIFRLVVRQGGLPVAAGIVAGTGLTLIATRFLASLLYGVRADDPVSLIGAPLLLLAAAGLALAKPARDAITVDPAITLRDE